MNTREFKKWAIGFSAQVLKLITVAWVVFMAYSSVMITMLIFKTGETTSIDTFILEVSKTFRQAVVAILVTRTVGNIFQYNNGGIFGESIGEENDG